MLYDVELSVLKATGVSEDEAVARAFELESLRAYIQGLNTKKPAFFGGSTEKAAAAAARPSWVSAIIYGCLSRGEGSRKNWARALSTTEAAQLSALCAQNPELLLTPKSRPVVLADFLYAKARVAYYQHVKIHANKLKPTDLFNAL